MFVLLTKRQTDLAADRVCNAYHYALDCGFERAFAHMVAADTTDGSLDS
jgi:hypothetical protein